MSSQEPSKAVCIIIHKTGVVLSDLPLLTLSADSAVRCSRASSVHVTDCSAATQGSCGGEGSSNNREERRRKMKHFVKAPTWGHKIHSLIFHCEKEKENQQRRKQKVKLMKIEIN